MKNKNYSEWYDHITDKLWDEFKIEVPLLLGVELFSNISDDNDLEVFLDELRDQKERGEEYDLLSAAEAVAINKYGEDDYIYYM